MSVNSQPTRGPKLRNSCDACNLAKVKCSKGRPSCARCHSHQFQCIYGVSMRSGKHPAIRHNIRKPSPESLQPVETWQRRSISADASSMLSEEENVLFEQSMSSMKDYLLLSDHWASFCHHADGHNILGDLVSSNEPTNLAQNHPQPYGQTLFPDFPPDIAWDNSNSIPQNLFFADSQSLAVPFNTPITPETPSAVLSRSSPSPPTATSLSSCSCQQNILQQLFELSKASSSPLSFDVVLNQNKEVIRFCHNILNDQTCFYHDTSYILTFAALIGKIISVYESIYPRHHHIPGSPKSSSHSRSNTWSLDDHLPVFTPDIDDAESVCSSANQSIPSPHWSAPFPSTISLHSMASDKTTIAPVRLTLGAYQLDQKDEEKLKMDIFRLELGKVENLISLFGQRYSGSSGQTLDEARSGDGTVGFLEKRLRDSLEVLRG